MIARPGRRWAARCEAVLRYGVVRLSTADLRAAPRHQSEMVSQALLGLVVEVAGRAVGDGWLRVTLPDGYAGWMRSWHMELMSKRDAELWRQRAGATVVAAYGPVLATRHVRGRRVRDLVLGCRLWCAGRSGRWARVVLPDGVRGWVASESVREGPGPPASGRAVVGTARLFLGAPYLWGGVSPKGADCSGLVQSSFGVHGVALPRDVSDQCRCGSEVPTDRAAPGDLLFFGPSRSRLDHVAIACGGRRFLHAGCPVEEGGLDSSRPGFHARLAPRLRLARRVLSKP